MAEPRTSLVRLSDRTAWVYAEYAMLGRHHDQLTLVRKDDTLILPSGTLGAVLLGPGTSVTHPGMELLAENCTSLLWTRGGGLGVFHTSSPPAFSTGSAAVQAQAQVVSNPAKRLEAARAMYQRRFDTPLHGDTLQEMMLAEGRRVKSHYRKLSEKYGVRWSRRGPGQAADAVNQNLDVVHHLMYGVCEVVTNVLGLSPALGVIHEGHARSFVLDLADLYKAESAEFAFQAASSGFSDPAELRQTIRDWVWEDRLFNRAIDDVSDILGLSGTPVEVTDAQHWWDGMNA